MGVWHSEEWPTLCVRGTTRTKVRGIANSKDSVLMQGFVHRRQSVRGHPKARSELGAMEHQNFLFDMERICVTQEWVDEGELPRERTKNQRWRRPYDVYDQSSWRVGLLQCSHSLKGARQVRGKSRDFHGVIDPLLSWRESIGRKRGRGGGECKDKLQVPSQGRRAEAKKLHKTDVDGLLIKMSKAGDFGLMQECSTKERSRQYTVLYLSTQKSR
ncbi:hypothetical protein B296_00016426 [Ensete ventricosum]|uniref:Uncharacterized protein n=1 Tax=Ensete ventricosum TaxID=4639 RepID=A0A426YMQ8_ENSVE|nr:hypothetical protein B296_00016426 [Ensete ventricosum]